MVSELRPEEQVGRAAYGSIRSRTSSLQTAGVSQGGAPGFKEQNPPRLSSDILSRSLCTTHLAQVISRVSRGSLGLKCFLEWVASRPSGGGAVGADSRTLRSQQPFGDCENRDGLSGP